MAGSIISDWINGSIDNSDNYTIKFIGNVVIVMVVSFLLFVLLGIDNIWVNVLLVGIISGLLVINLNILEGNATLKLILNTGLFTFCGFFISGLIFVLIALSSLDPYEYGMLAGFASAMADLMYYVLAGFFVETGFVAALLAIFVKWIKSNYSQGAKTPVTTAPKMVNDRNFGTCSHCGATIESKDQEFCTECGKPLNKKLEEKTVCDVCGRPVNEGDKICSNCGNLL